MKILRIVIAVLGLAAIVFGAVADPAVFSQKLTVSCIVLGVIVFLVGALMLLSAANEKARRVVHRLTERKEFTLILFLIVIVYFFWLINPNFVSVNNVKGILNSAFSMGTLAIGIGCLLISGEIDLSAGATGMLAGVLLAMLMRAGMSWVPAVVIVLLFGVVTGLVNAFFVNVMHFMAFISTLAISTAFGGLALILTNAQNISISDQAFWTIGSATLFGVLPLPFVIMIVLFIIYAVVLTYTGFGRRIYMIGGNQNAARLAGINAKRIKTILFVNGSVVSALTGIVIASRMHMGSTTAVTGAEMDAITVAVLGGIAFTGGVGNMLGVAIATVLIAAFQNGLVIVELPAYYQVVAKGVLLIAALLLDYYRERSRQRALLRH